VSRLWSFNGGVHLNTHKDESGQAPLRPARLPKELVYPLSLRGGMNAEPMVAVGERVLKGQAIARGDGPMNPPLHAATSGVVRSIEMRPLPHPSGLSDLCMVINADGADEAVESQGVADYTRLVPEELRARIHEAGVVGLGGAAFPTSIKVNPGERRAVDTLILNGAECEPYISCDDSLLRHFPEQVLGGAKILMRILQVERCLLGIESDMPQAIAALERALRQGDYGGIEIVPVPVIYPTGGEKQLIKVLTGREVPANGIPADAGVICQNVGTAAAIYKAIVEGEPIISRIVTVTGAGVRQPQNLLVRIGTPIAELIEQCGGYTPQAQRLILGGPMMGFSVPSDDLPVVKSTNCILAVGPQEVIGQTMPCIRCGACASACPVSLLPQQLYWYARSDNLERALDYRLPDCIECGCCDVVCPSHIPLVQYFRAAKSKLAAKERERRKADHARIRFDAHQARKERERLERAENARRKKEALSKVLGTQPAQEKAESAAGPEQMA
jgi:electron transport complex protein RnfC